MTRLPDSEVLTCLGPWSGNDILHFRPTPLGALKPAGRLLVLTAHCADLLRGALALAFRRTAAREAPQTPLCMYTLGA